jgi:ABC-type glutathione transport system ATPase component
VEALLKLENVSKTFGLMRKKRVMDNVNLALPTGAIMGLIGETGHGKTSLARIITGLVRPDSGQVIFKGKTLPVLKYRNFADCAAIQYVFQDPYSALDADSRVEQVLGESLSLCRKHHKNEFILPEDCLQFVGLGYSREWLRRRAGSLSGGQRQKLILARALIPMPELLIADESTSMLDMASGLEVVGLFKKINQTWKTTILIISHQMDIIKNACTDVAVMHNGGIVENGTLNQVLERPNDPYVRELIQVMKLFSGGN